MIDGYQITAPGVTVTATASTANVAIPFDQGGVNRARICRIQSTGFNYIRVGNSAVTATTSDMLLSPNEAAYLITGGCTHIAYLTESGGAKINIAPIES